MVAERIFFRSTYMFTIGDKPLDMQPTRFFFCWQTQIMTVKHANAHLLNYDVLKHFHSLILLMMSDARIGKRIQICDGIAVFIICKKYTYI